MPGEESRVYPREVSSGVMHIMKNCVWISTVACAQTNLPFNSIFSINFLRYFHILVLEFQYPDPKTTNSPIS